MIKVNSTLAIDIEQPESYFVFRIRLHEEIIVRAPVDKVNLPSFLPVCDIEQNRILLSLYFVLFRLPASAIVLHGQITDR